MNETPPTISQASYPPPYVYTVPPWPPPSGGAPFAGSELGPILNPYPYGSTQGANISTSPPSPPAAYPPPWGGLKGTFYPQKMPVAANGQNQGGSYQLPKPTPPWEVGPIAAPPSISAGNPPYSMGPLH